MLHRPVMWPMGTDDGDADAMATGRLYPDLYMRIYLFHISFACAARICRRASSPLAPERRIRASTELRHSGTSLRGRGHVGCSTSCSMFKGSCAYLSALRRALFR